jgi:hypothetical protein
MSSDHGKVLMVQPRFLGKDRRVALSLILIRILKLRHPNIQMFLKIRYHNDSIDQFQQNSSLDIRGKRFSTSVQTPKSQGQVRVVSFQSPNPRPARHISVNLLGIIYSHVGASRAVTIMQSAQGPAGRCPIWPAGRNEESNSTPPGHIAPGAD